MTASDDELERLLAETIAPPKVPNKPLDPLDALLWEAVESQRAEGELKQKKAAIAKLKTKEEREQALAEYKRLADARIWSAITNVAYFDTQHCVCGRDHAFFRGWYTEFKHKTDPHARRLAVGKAVERLPERIELSFKGTVELCIDCVGVHVGANRLIDALDSDTRRDSALQAVAA